MSHTTEEYCRSCADTVQVVQRKWKIHILCYICSGPVRLGQLRRELRHASKKVLIQNLLELEDAGLVVRRDFGGSVQHVEYDFSEAMRPQIQAMLDHLAEFGETIGDRRLDLQTVSQSSWLP